MKNFPNFNNKAVKNTFLFSLIYVMLKTSTNYVSVVKIKVLLSSETRDLN